MASITTRSGKGSPLTNDEVDANFTNINTELGEKLPKAGGTVTGNIVMSSNETVDGRDVSVDGTKLDGIEAQADKTDTANVVAALTAGTNVTIAADGTIASTGGGGSSMTDAEVKTAYENNSNTNAYTDAEKTKLTNVEAGATADQTAAEIKAAYEGSSNTNAFTDAEKTKLGNIETGATANQTDAEIKTAYENNSNTNAFTDAEKTKLGSIEASATADQTAGEIEAVVSHDNLQGVSANQHIDWTASGAGTIHASNYTDTNTTYNVGDGGLTQKNFTTTLNTKLAGIEDNAKDDQTAGEIEAIVNHDNLQGFVANEHIDWSSSGTGTIHVSHVVNALTAGANVTINSDGTISSTGSSGSGDVNQNAFSNFAVSGQTTVAADQTTDTVTFVGGSNVTITTNATTDTITIASTDTNTTYSVGDGGLTQKNFTTALNTKLAGIETSATADQTDAEIKTAYENNSDRNAYTDAEKTKLAGIEANATADQTAAEIEAIVSHDSLQGFVANEHIDWTASSAGTIHASNYTDTDTTYTVGDGGLTQKNFTTALDTKLAGIEASATADQTDAEIKTAYENNSNTNAYTDAEKTKLTNIETAATADQTDAEILTAVKNVDGAASGLDADLLDGQHGAYYTAYADSAVSNLVGAAPAALNSLNELATALGDDANFATTVTNNLATKLPLAGGTMTGNIAMTGTGTVDGRDLSVDGTKLDGIETAATADQTDAEIKSAYENNSNTNAYTDAEKTKLAGVETGATADQTSSEIEAIVNHDNLQGFVAAEHIDWSTSQASNIHTGNYTNTTYTVQDGELSQKNFTTALKTKLDGIEATANETTQARVLGHISAGTNVNITAGGVISSTYAAPTSTATTSANGLMSSADKTKLDGVETGATADQTAGEIEAIVSHNNLQGVSANQHIDWTASGAGTIHSSNYTDTNTTYSVGDGGLTQKNFTTALNTKLAGVETGATADQTASEIEGIVNHDNLQGFVANEHLDWTASGAGTIHASNYTDTNTTYSVGDGGLTEKNFTTALNTKLAGIEASADVTDTDNVVAALTAGTGISIAANGTVASTSSGTSYQEIIFTVSGGNYLVDGTANQTMTLLPSITYRLNVSDNSVASHPLKFSTNSAVLTNSTGATPFTTGITEVGTRGTTGAYIQVKLEQDAPTLYYYCSSHAGMGGNVSQGGTTYTLPTATSSALGGVKVGSGLQISSGVLSAVAAGSTDYSVTAYTASAGNTTFNASSSPALPAYSSGRIAAYVNGVKRNDITATNGTSVVFGTALLANDVVEIVNHGSGNVVLPTALGTAGQAIKVNAAGNALEFSAAGGVDNVGTLTKTFSQNEETSITLSASVSPVPVVSVFKEMPTETVSSKESWDVNSTGSNYIALNLALSAFSGATLTPSAVGAGTFSLSTGSFSSSDVGKRVEGNGGVAIITAASGTYTVTTNFTNTNVIAAGDWSLYGTKFETDGSGVTLSGSTSGYNLSNVTYGHALITTTNNGGTGNTVTDMYWKSDGLRAWAVAYNDYVYEYSCTSAWDVNTMAFVKKVNLTNSGYSGQSYITNGPTGVAFKSDGSVMYIMDRQSKRLYQITLTTAWDIDTGTTVTYKSIPQQVSGSEPQHIKWKPDGTKFFYLEADSTASVNDQIRAYNCTTAWDVTSGSLQNEFWKDFINAGPKGFTFNSDGTRLYICGWASNTLGGSTGTSAYSADFAALNSGGYKVYELDLINTNYGDVAYEPKYINNSARNLYADYHSVVYDGTFSAIPCDIEFSPDGTTMIILSQSQDGFHSHSPVTVTAPTGAYFPTVTAPSGQIDTSNWTDINTMVADQATNSGTIQYAISTDNHATWKVIHNTLGVRKIAKNNSGTWQYNSASGTTATGYAIASASSDSKSLAYNSQDSLGNDLRFNSDGTKLFLSGGSNHSVYEYHLSTAYDLSTVSYDSAFSHSSQLTNGVSLTFNSAGTKMYMLGISGNIFQYTLSTAFDVSTASYDNVTIDLPSAQITYCIRIRWNDDGTKLYALGRLAFGVANNKVYQYTCSTAYDLSTVSYSNKSFDISSQSTNSTQILEFNSAGTKMFVGTYVNNSTDPRIYQYTLSTAFDVSTASYDNVSWQLPYCNFVVFSADGTKAFAGNNNTDSIHQYSVSTSAYAYNTNETWTNATTNNELSCLQQALGNQVNRMDKTQLDAVADANHIPLGSTLDLMIAPYVASGVPPKSDGVTINYDAAAVYEQAVAGTDYRARFPASTTVQIKSLAAQNLKVRVL